MYVRYKIVDCRRKTVSFCIDDIMFYFPKMGVDTDIVVWNLFVVFCENRFYFALISSVYLNLPGSIFLCRWLSEKCDGRLEIDWAKFSAETELYIGRGGYSCWRNRNFFLDGIEAILTAKYGIRVLRNTYLKWSKRRKRHNFGVGGILNMLLDLSGIDYSSPSSLAR